MEGIANLIDVGVEQALCGAIIHDPSQAHKINGLVNMLDFSDRGLAKVFELLVSMVNGQENPRDITLLKRKLAEANLFEEVGGAPGIARLLEQCGSPASSTTYAKRIAKLAACRRLTQLSQRLFLEAQGNSADPVELSSWAQAQLQCTMPVDSKEMLTVHEAFMSAIKTNRENQEAKRSDFISTGLMAVDSVGGGLKRGDMTVIAARPSVGKTAFATQLACHAALAGRRVLFVSLEMYVNDIAWRIAASHGISDNRRLRYGRLSSEEWEQVESLASQWRDVPLVFWSPRKMPKASEVAARARVMHMTSGIDLVVLDYLQLVAPESSIAKRNEQVARITVELKSMVKELGCASVILAQLNRKAEGQKPSLSDLKESGAIEENADNVWLLHRAERNSEEALVIMAKQRGGPTGEVALKYDLERTAFADGTEYA